MKKKWSINKDNIMIVFLFLLVLCVVGTTIAFFTSYSHFDNKFETSQYNVSLKEEFYNDWGVKKVSVVNNEINSTPVVVRINYDEVWYKEVDGTMLFLSNIVLDGKEQKRAVTLNTTKEFQEDFILGNDGWYYYKKVLNPGESVQVLNSIALNEDVIKLSEYYGDYKIYNYDLSYNYEAVQASPTAIETVWGYKAEISDDGNINWHID